MNSFFTFSQVPQVKKLLGWRQGSEEEKWAEKAVDSLCKKLKKKKSGQGTLEDLEFALANPGMASKCVTIPKSLDGRLQVSHKKGLPHVIYCRVWRWPDLQSHQELRPIPECMYPYDQKASLICINPYHYQRVEHAKPFIPPPANTTYHASSPYSSISSASSSSGYPGPCSSASPPLGRQIPSPVGSYVTASPMAYSYATATSPSSALSDDDAEIMRTENQLMNGGMHSMAMSFKPIQIPIAATNYWATIGYYELNNRIGDIFRLENRRMIIDGFTDPSNSDGRICLGALSSVNRNSTIESTRRHIGKGLRLDCSNDYNIHLTNLSEVASLFIHSRNVNLKMSQPPTTVCRIPPGHTFCIFDNALFNQKLQSAQKEGAVALYDLQKMCFIRLSFVKGWGSEYQRHDITSTPCWIEIQLYQPLAWIDSSIQSVPSPEIAISSVS